MSYRIRPVARRPPKHAISFRIVAIGAAVALVLVGTAALPIWIGSHGTAPLAPIAVRKAAGKPGTAWQLTISPDGRTVAASTGVNVELWDIDSMAVTGEFRGLNFGTISSLAFIGGGRGLVAGGQGDYALIDVAARRVIWGGGIGVEGNTNGSFSIYMSAFPGTSRFVMAYPAWMDVIEWNGTTDPKGGAVNPESRIRTISTLSSGSRPQPIGVAVSPDGSVIAEITTTKSVLLFNAVSGGFLGELPGSLDLSSVSFSDDSHVLATAAGAQHDRVILWDVAKRQELRTLKGSEGSSYTAVFRPGGRVVAVGGLKSLALWDSAKGTAIADVAVPESIQTMVFDPSGRRLVTAGEVLSQWELSP